MIHYWQNQRIDYSLFTNELLGDPSDSIQYSLENLAHQKEEITAEMPYLFDRELLRINSTKVKDSLQDYPGECLNKLYGILPPYIYEMKENIGDYMGKAIKVMRAATTNVADFVAQIKEMRKIDRKLPKVRTKINFIGQVVNILESMKQHAINLDK